jgi:hypothetical protein
VLCAENTIFPGIILYDTLRMVSVHGEAHPFGDVSGLINNKRKRIGIAIVQTRAAPTHRNRWEGRTDSQFRIIIDSIERWGDAGG